MNWECVRASRHGVDIRFQIMRLSWGVGWVRNSSEMGSVDGVVGTFMLV